LGYRAGEDEDEDEDELDSRRREKGLKYFENDR
jgi:hypothetical protein